jgi:hypothetical protein
VISDIFRIFEFIKTIKDMNTLKVNSEYNTIELDGTTYYHYSYGGKFTSQKSIKVYGTYWYDTNKPPVEERV